MQTSDRLDARSVVEREHSLVTTVNEDDPAAASVRGRHTSRLTRGDICYAATSNVSIQASEHRFDVAIALDVEINGRLHFSRR